MLSNQYEPCEQCLYLTFNSDAWPSINVMQYGSNVKTCRREMDGNGNGRINKTDQF